MDQDGCKNTSYMLTNKQSIRPALSLILIEAQYSSITKTGQCYPLMGGQRGSLGPGWTHYLMAPGWPLLTSQLCALK